MKLKVLLCVSALVGAFLPCLAYCRPADSSISPHQLLPRPLLLHLGEEFSLQLGGGGGSSSGLDLLSSSSSSSSSSAVNRALLQLTQRLLQARAEQEEESAEKGKRSEEPPISLDLTFHLLREVLEMARAEQLAVQADSNRRMMDELGKK